MDAEGYGLIFRKTAADTSGELFSNIVFPYQQFGS
jgi:hypothetical protein